jgi:hypothetical protein
MEPTRTSVVVLGPVDVFQGFDIITVANEFRGHVPKGMFMFRGHAPKGMFMFRGHVPVLAQLGIGAVKVRAVGMGRNSCAGGSVDFLLLRRVNLLFF